MIPPPILRFLDGATVATGGTRDKALAPQVHRASGWMVGPDQQTITCLIPEASTRDRSNSLEDNGQFALMVTGSTTGPNASVPPRPSTDAHETYQFKGDYVGSRAVNDGDRRVWRACQERFVRLFCPLFGFSERAARAFIQEPSVAIDFKVHEIYVQTPGPGAGRRLEPEDE